MNPKRLITRRVTPREGRDRLRIALEYLAVAQLIDAEDGASINVCIGVAVLAGIAASDAICADALGLQHSGTDHRAAADLLARVDAKSARRLRDLIDLKNASHYGSGLLTATDRRRALRSAESLVDEAFERTQ